MSAYRVLIEEGAEQDIRRLPGHVRQRVRRLILDLGHEPRPYRAVELRGHPGYWRQRLLAWRVLYRLEDDPPTVTVIGVPRKRGPETYVAMLGEDT